MAEAEADNGPTVRVNVASAVSGNILHTTALPLKATIADLKRSLCEVTGLHTEQMALLSDSLPGAGASSKVLESDLRMDSILEVVGGHELQLQLVVQEHRPWTMRWSKRDRDPEWCSSRGYYETFGTVIHLHSLKGGSEGIVIFATQAAAEAAKEDGVKKHPAYQTSEPLCETKWLYGRGLYWENIDRMLNCMDGLVEEPLRGSLLEAWRNAAETELPQHEVAQLLLRLRSGLPDDLVRDHVALDTWTVTMRMFARGELSQHIDRFADTSTNELLTCLDTTRGRLDEAWAETE